MLNIMYKDKNGKTWKQASKAAARKAYNAGLKITLCAANMRPGFPYYPEIVTDKERMTEVNAGEDVDFEKLVNHFEYYNCTSETGKYTRFYLEA